MHVDPKNLPLSKCFIVLFLFTQVIFGLDFGFTKAVPKNLRRVLNFVCLLLSANIIVVSIIPMVNAPPPGFVIYLTTTIEYTCYTFVLIIWSKYTMYDFLLDIALIDANLNLDKKDLNTIILKTFIYALISFAFKVSASYIYCFVLSIDWYCSWSVHFIPYFLPLLGRDMPSILQYLIMYTLYRRFHILKIKLAKNELNEKTILVRYKDMLECMYKIKPLFGVLVSFIPFDLLQCEILNHFILSKLDFTTFSIPFKIYIIGMIDVNSVSLSLITFVPKV